LAASLLQQYSKEVD